jgi:hypothetical protein
VRANDVPAVLIELAGGGLFAYLGSSMLLASLLTLVGSSGLAPLPSVLASVGIVIAMAVLAVRGRSVVGWLWGGSFIGILVAGAIQEFQNASEEVMPGSVVPLFLGSWVLLTGAALISQAWHRVRGEDEVVEG